MFFDTYMPSFVDSDDFEDLEEDIRQLIRQRLRKGPMKTKMLPFKRYKHCNNGGAKCCKKLPTNDTTNNAMVPSEGSSKLNLQFDMRNYQPDEITVKVVDNKLTVQAKHEEKTDTKYVYNEFNEEIILPEGTDLSTIKTILKKDGLLSIEGQLPQLEETEKLLPIEQQN